MWNDLLFSFVPFLNPVIFFSNKFRIQIYMNAVVCCCLVTKSCPTLYPTRLHYSEISQTRILKWVAIFSTVSTWPEDRIHVSFVGRWILYHLATREAYICINSVHFILSVVSDSLWPHGLQYTRLPCPSSTPGAYSNSCPLNWWYLPTISSSVFPFSHLKCFPASGSFQMSPFFASGGQSIGVSASVFPMNIQDWFPLGCTGWICLLSKGVSRVFANTTLYIYIYIYIYIYVI